MESPPLVRHYLRALRRQLWLVALVLGVALVSVGLIVSLQARTYRASMKIVVGQGGGVFRPADTGGVDSFTETMTNLLQSRVVADSVIRDLGLRTSADALLSNLHVSSQPQSSVLTVSYDSTDQAEAGNVLSDVGHVFGTLVARRLGADASRGPTQVTASVFDPPHLEPGAVAPRPLRALVFAAFAGLVVGVLIVIVRERVDTRIYGVAEAERAIDAPVLGALPRSLRPRGAPLPRARERSDEELAPLDALTANVRFGLLPGGGVITVTSALAGEGRSTVAAGLAATLALSEDVICVEADAGAPALGEYVGAARAEVGLMDVLVGEVALDEALVEVSPAVEELDDREVERLRVAGGAQATAARRATRRRVAGLRMLHAGPHGGGVGRRLTPDATAKLLTSLRRAATYVVIDAPPLLRRAGGFALAVHADAVIVVAREGRTTAANAAAVRSLVDRFLDRNTGVVLIDSGELVPERWPVPTQ